VLGLTFKENVPDLRNSKVVDLVDELTLLGHAVEVHDALASAGEALREYGIALLPELPASRFDAVVLAVPHAAYRDIDPALLAALVAPGGVFADLRNALPAIEGQGVRRWRI
jgi:UDP-N-acetyl-D-galactosamine dehydrogenase